MRESRPKVTYPDLNVAEVGSEVVMFNLYWVQFYAFYAKTRSVIQQQPNKRHGGPYMAYCSPAVRSALITNIMLRPV